MKAKEENNIKLKNEYIESEKAYNKAQTNFKNVKKSLWINTQQKQIEILIEQKELSLRLGKNAKQLVIEKFNWEKLSIEFLNAVKPYLK